MKAELQPGNAVLQIDYAENYSLISQDEIQSAHWGHSQVTLFTACVWYPEGVKSYVVVSDDLTHSKESSWLFLKVIIEDFKRFVYPDLLHLKIFSDNCTSQFKSRYTVSNICYLADDLNISSVTWSLFAPGHGNGAVDAIGGQLKQQIWMKVKSRSVSINTAKEFYETALKVAQATHILYVPKDNVTSSSGLLQERWKNVKQIPGIHGYYHFRRLDSKHIQAARTCESEFKTVQVFELDQEVETGKSDRTRYYDVFSSSDSEEENLYMPESKDQQTNVQPHTVNKSDIGPDTYVVVTLSSAIGKTENLHKFIAICQSVVDDSGFLKVLFLKPIASRRDQFKISDEGEKIIAFDEIIEILPKPQILPMGDRIYYHFLEGNLPQ